MIACSILSGHKGFWKNRKIVLDLLDFEVTIETTFNFLSWFIFYEMLFFFCNFSYANDYKSELELRFMRFIFIDLKSS